MKELIHIEAYGPEKGIATIFLNRPEVHNAFNIEMIRELLRAFAEFESDDRVRIILIKGRGENFSAGADLKWMKECMNQTEQELKNESRDLARLFQAIYESGKVTMVLATGKVIGGANGLLAAADIALSSPETSFAFTEAKLGLIPATIAPYVIHKTGSSIAREWFLTARPVDSLEAKSRGLVHFVVEKSALDKKAMELCEMLLKNGPQALRHIKDMMHIKGMSERPNHLLEETVEILSGIRASAEAQEGIQAFLEKRKARWIDGN